MGEDVVGDGVIGCGDYFLLCGVIKVRKESDILFVFEEGNFGVSVKVD